MSFLHDVQEDVGALAKNISRRLSRVASKRRPVNILSPQETNEMKVWEREGRSEVSFRSKEFSVSSKPSAAAVPSTDSSMGSCNGTYALRLLRDEALVDELLIGKVKRRMQTITKAIEAFDKSSEEALTQDEVLYIRKCLLVEIGCGDLWPYLSDMEHNNAILMQRLTPASLNFVKEIYKGEASPILVEDDPKYSKLRRMARTTSDPFLGDQTSLFSPREWFASRGVQMRPVYTCSMVTNSDILMGQGPNGGHIGHGMFSSNVPPSKRQNLDTASHFTHLTNHLQELWLSGVDINRFFYHKMKRDDEVIGFLIELNEMKVGTVIANGFPRSYSMTNMKTILAPKGPYADNHFFMRPGFQTMTRTLSTYKKTTPRDFFNYFGAEDGDDGLIWEEYQDGKKRLYIQDFVLYSKLVKSVPNEQGSRMDLYELTVSRQNGCPCVDAEYEFTLNVLNIRTWDQAPAMLSDPQVKLLVDVMIEVDDENHYIFVHCAGGIGRTGNLAFAMSEVLCEDVPGDPLQKLDWLRMQRPGSVQTPEQFLDGMILSYKILEEVVHRTKSFSPD